MAHDTAKSRQKQRAKVYDKNIKETFSNPVVQEVALTALPGGSLRHIAKVGKVVPAVKAVAKKAKSLWMTSGTKESKKRITATAKYRKKVVEHIKIAENIKPSIGVEQRLGHKGRAAHLKALRASRTNRKLTNKDKRILDIEVPRAERILKREIATHPARKNPPAGVDLLLKSKVLKGKPANERSLKYTVIHNVLKTREGGRILTGSKVVDKKPQTVPAVKKYIPSGMEKYGKAAEIPNVFVHKSRSLQSSQPQTTSVMERGAQYRTGVKQRVEGYNKQNPQTKDQRKISVNRSRPPEKENYSFTKKERAAMMKARREEARDAKKNPQKYSSEIPF